MSRFPNAKKPVGDGYMPAGRAFGGTYSCQTCDEIVVSAVHVADTQELYWQCTEGHVSKIPFKL